MQTYSKSELNLVHHAPMGILVETNFFIETYHRLSHMIDRQRPYLLAGKVEEDWGAVTLSVDKLDRITR